MLRFHFHTSHAMQMIVHSDAAYFGKKMYSNPSAFCQWLEWMYRRSLGSVAEADENHHDGAKLSPISLLSLDISIFPLVLLPM
mmetsp:Transcript_56754/g.169491  ORF Transcript_56754/g.169491 Transcript_56754/m.169491 type:complete len:83 (+) Transcript_56754:862-1110(+)